MMKTTTILILLTFFNIPAFMGQQLNLWFLDDAEGSEIKEVYPLRYILHHNGSDTVKFDYDSSNYLLKREHITFFDTTTIIYNYSSDYSKAIKIKTRSFVDSSYYFLNSVSKSLLSLDSLGRVTISQQEDTDTIKWKTQYFYNEEGQMYLTAHSAWNDSLQKRVYTNVYFASFDDQKRPLNIVRQIYDTNNKFVKNDRNQYLRYIWYDEQKAVVHEDHDHSFFESYYLAEYNSDMQLSKSVYIDDENKAKFEYNFEYDELKRIKTITDENGDIKSEYIYDTDLITGKEKVSTQSSKSIEVYPNPASNFIKVKLPSTSGKASVMLKNMEGKIIHSKSINSCCDLSTTIDVSDIPGGLYIIDYNSPTHSFSKKVLVLR